jgi:hypothetical protein
MKVVTCRICAGARRRGGCSAPAGLEVALDPTAEHRPDGGCRSPRLWIHRGGGEGAGGGRRGGRMRVEKEPGGRRRRAATSGATEEWRDGWLVRV